mmetsp:Transcript_32861/g.104820  ORF Transcript_32861/g.104820 Transcript_32861/m.104820 type:complete len:620 (-) Transcript_32861:1260-3119(-)
MSRTQSKLQVKNRQPAPIQITAEQILREAHDRAGGDLSLGKTSRTQNLQRARITDPEELREYRTSRRKHFEDAIRSNRMGLGTYVKYAQWEEAQEEFERARSVWERALAIDHRAPSLWAKYAEMEMKNKFVNHARNVWDRAVSLLPRVDSLWYKYTHMEEMLENFAVARTVWDRWMKWEPEEAAWFSYVRFEERRGEVQKARTVWDRFLSVFPTVRSYLKVAKWEERQRQPTLARTIYERAFAELGDWEMSSGDKANLYSSFASFEERHGEIDRARAVFQYALNNLDDDQDDDDEVEEVFPPMPMMPPGGGGTPDQFAEQMENPELLRTQARQLREMDPDLVRRSNPNMRNFSDAQIKFAADQMDLMAGNPAMMEMAKQHMKNMTPEQLSNMQDTAAKAGLAAGPGMTAPAAGGATPPAPGGMPSAEQMAGMMDQMDPAMMENMIDVVKKNPDMLKSVLKSNPMFGNMSDSAIDAQLDMLNKVDPATMKKWIGYASKAQKVFAPAVKLYAKADKAIGQGRLKHILRGAALAFLAYLASRFLVWLSPSVFGRVFPFLLGGGRRGSSSPGATSPLADVLSSSFPPDEREASLDDAEPGVTNAVRDALRTAGAEDDEFNDLQ